MDLLKLRVGSGVIGGKAGVGGNSLIYGAASIRYSFKELRTRQSDGDEGRAFRMPCGKR